MATDVLDENHFNNQCSLYDSSCVQLTKDSIHHQTPPSPVLAKPSLPQSAPHKRVKYSTQTPSATSHSLANSIHNRHGGSTDLFSFIRSLAMKPFKTSSMAHAVADGETSNVVGGSSNMRHKPSVNLLKYRPLSDVLTDHAPYGQPNHMIEEFLKQMDWPVDSTTPEGRIKWNIATKFLIASKYDINRAVDLYKTHEDLRKAEKLDHIWINNPCLIDEIQSRKFYSLPQMANQPLTIIYKASDVNYSVSTDSVTQADPELIALQSLICQLDVATESLEVQRNGIDFIYDMQNYSASQFNMNLTKKVFRLLQGGYPALFKNIFAISAPKWFRVIYKVTFCSVDQMCECLTKQYGYSLDSVPISMGGTYDPALTGHLRYQACLSKVANNQSICYPYYCLDYETPTTQSTNNQSYSDINNANPNKSVVTIKATTVSSVPLMLNDILYRHHDGPSTAMRLRKRESSTSSDHDKRQRSTECPIEEELPVRKSSALRKENFNERWIRSGNSSNGRSNQRENDDFDARNSMNEIGRRDSKCDSKRLTNKCKPLTESEFLSKTNSEIRQEFRRLPNPPAQDPYVARYEYNLEKSRYRDVIPGEATRVKLDDDTDDDNDFINANYVSGYNDQERAYVFTQGPLQSTVKDFWRMVWQENISVIVMTTNIRESGTMKCYPYWPLKSKEHITSGSFQIQNEKSESYDSFIITTLSLKKKNHPDVRAIYHAHYLKWPDHGVPSGTRDALSFLETVDFYKQLDQTNAPVLLHCSAGIGRTGTFCAIDIGIKRYLAEKLIDITSTVIKMRQERAGSVQTEDQYLFAHLALMDFIRRQQTIQEKNQNLEFKNSKKTMESNQAIRSLSNRDSISQKMGAPNESTMLPTRSLILSINGTHHDQIAPIEAIPSIPFSDDNEIDRQVRT